MNKKREGAIDGVGVLGESTLKQLLDQGSLTIQSAGVPLSYESLKSQRLIDETSINLNIGKLYRHSPSLPALDVEGKYDDETDYESVEPDDFGGVIVQPGDFLLGKSHEAITTPSVIVGTISERRTVAGNLGIAVTGFIPPGLHGETVRFTLHNKSSRPVKLYVGHTPPMKVIFQTLSSAEVYRKGRQARVSDSQVYSSGAGEKLANPGTVLAMFAFDPKISVRETLAVNFRVENATSILINTVSIAPIVSTEAFRITSGSPGWQLHGQESHIELGAPPKDVVPLPELNVWQTLANLAKGRQPACTNSSLSRDEALQPGEVLDGTFNIRFLRAYTAHELKFRVDCLSNGGERVPVKYITNPPLEVVSHHSPILSKVKEHFVTALIAAAILWLFTRFEPQISEVIKSFSDWILKLVTHL